MLNAYSKIFRLTQRLQDSRENFENIVQPNITCDQLAIFPAGCPLLPVKTASFCTGRYFALWPILKGQIFQLLVLQRGLLSFSLSQYICSGD
jgi:hypothetical protein